MRTRPTERSQSRLLSFPPWGMASRVYSQIHDDLLNLTPIRSYPAKFRGELDGHLNVLTNRAPKDLSDVGHDDAEIQNFWLQQLLAAEGQELSRQRGSPLRSLVDFHRLLVQGVGGTETLQHELTTANNHS